jgi:hypothetical protein
MIACKVCEFEVNNSMRHSLVKNICPACGAALFGDFHMRRLNLLKQKILEQEFSEALDESSLFDICLFILTEFFVSKPGIVNTKLDQGNMLDISMDEQGLEEGELIDFSEAEPDQSYDEIRDEIRKEVLADVDEELVEAEEDLRIARLKRIAKESPTNKNPGAIVRRVTD